MALVTWGLPASQAQEVDPARVDSIRRLGDQLEDVRLDAMEELRRMGPAAAFAFAPLCRVALEDESGLVREVAAIALRSIAPERAFKALGEEIGTTADPARRIAAIEAVERVVLADNLGSPDEEHRLRPDAAMLPLLSALDSGIHSLESAALACLVQIAPWASEEFDADVVRRLADALESLAPDTRFLAVSALTGLGPRAAGAVASLRRMLRAGVLKGDRARAAQALGRIGPAAEVALPDLADVARGDTSEDVRRFALLAVIAIVRSGTGLENVALTALRYGLGDGAAQVRASALSLSVEIGPTAAQLVPQIAPLLRSEDGFERGHAATALGRIRDVPESIIIEIEGLLSDPDAGVRAAAGGALSTIRLKEEAPSD